MSLFCLSHNQPYLLYLLYFCLSLDKNLKTVLQKYKTHEALADKGGPAI